MLLTTIVIFIIILGVLVFVHEFGHFIMAKRAGIRVDEFGFGFPPRIFGIKRGETIYSLNAIPLGGFVKILGEDGEEKENPRSFANKSILTRAKILASGVTMNFLVAILFLTIGFSLGLPTAIEDTDTGNYKDVKVQISAVDSKSPAEAAGLRMGDIITEMQTATATVYPAKVQEVQDFNAKFAGTEITLKIQRGSENLNVKVTPRKNPPPGEGQLGVALARTAMVSYPIHKALALGIFTAFAIIARIFMALWEVIQTLFRGGTAGMELAGPVGIAALTGQMAELGFVYVLQFTAILSVNLAVINALPFPALDGGRLLFLLIEKIKGMPISQKLENAVHTAGFVFLILLLVLVTFKDVARLDLWDKIIKFFT